MWVVSRITYRRTAISVLGLVLGSMALAPSTARSAMIALFDDNGTASSTSGNATQGLDTTAKDWGAASWKITDTGATQDYFTVKFILNDRQAPLSTLDPANGSHLWMRYLTNTPDFRVRFSMDVWDDTNASYYPVYNSGSDTQADLIGGDGQWRTLMLTPSTLVSTSLNQNINRTYRLIVQSWPSGPGFTQVQGSTINLDGISVGVPEPAALGILGLSSVMLVWRRRRA